MILNISFYFIKEIIVFISFYYHFSMWSYSSTYCRSQWPILVNLFLMK